MHPVLLDRSRPLSKLHVLQGLAPAANGHRRVVLYTQLHHAAIDGQAAVALARIVLDTGPEPRSVVPRASTRQKAFALGLSEMLRGALANEAQQVAQPIRNLPSTVDTFKNAAARALGGSTLRRRAREAPVSNFMLAPPMPLNVSVFTGRACATFRLPLPELKALGQAHDASINDIVLMLCSSALRRHDRKMQALPRKSRVVAVPISPRIAGDTTAGRQASMSLVSLGTHIAKALKRLAHVKAATQAMKSTMGSLKSILPTDFPSIGVPWLIEAATAMYGGVRVAEKIPQLTNLVISNVPGPPVPLYLAGARMLTNHPASNITHGLALNITVQSCDRSLDFGLMADAVAMPDVRDPADAIRIAFDDIRALPRPGSHDDDEYGADWARC